MTMNPSAALFYLLTAVWLSLDAVSCTSNFANGRDLQSDNSSGSESSAACSEIPFIWKILRVGNNTDGAAEPEIAAFAIGTIDMDKDVALSENAWQSMIYAAKDSCVLYGERDPFNEYFVPEVDCISSIPNEATVQDVPDAELKEKFLAVLGEIKEEYFSETDSWESYDDMSLYNAMEMIKAYNTPESKDSFFRDPDLLNSETMSKSLERKLSFGRYVFPSFWCFDGEHDRLAPLSPSRDDFLADFDTHWRGQVETALRSNYSGLIEAYKCGNQERVLEWLDEAGPSRWTNDDMVGKTPSAGFFVQ